MNSEQKVDSSNDVSSRTANRLPATFVETGRAKNLGLDSNADQISREKPIIADQEQELQSFIDNIRSGVIRNMAPQLDAVRFSKDRTSVFRSYHEGQETLRKMEKEFLSFVTSIISAAIDESNPHNPLMFLENGRLKDNLLRDPRLVFSFPRSLVDKTTLDLDLAKLRSMFCSHLDRSTLLFSSSVVERLAALFEMKISGTFQWKKDQCVVLSYVQQRQERDEKVIRTGIEATWDYYPSSEEDEEFSVGRDQELVEIQTILTHTTYEHFLTEAFETSVENREVRLPHSAQSIVSTFPKWLGSKLKVIHGNLVGERQVEIQQVSTEDVVRTLEIEDTSIYPDPAIVFGPFVLMGWVDRSSPIIEQPVDPVVKALEQKSVHDSYLLGGILVCLGIVCNFLYPHWFNFAYGFLGFVLIASIHLIQGAGRRRKTT